MNPDLFIKELGKQGIVLNEQQVQSFSIYYQTLIKWNEKINLTGLTSLEDVYLKHFYDSISAAFHFDFNDKLHICDVGAGAGFPSIPLKICFPHLKVTIVDSLQKRIGFLNHLAKELDLSNVSFYHSRAEDFGRNRKYRESYDVVMARAVAKMSVISELCLPLCKENGVFIAMKGAHLQEELRDAGQALKVLGGEMKRVKSFTLPIETSRRSIVIINKKRKTPNKYPRKAGSPSKKPIT